MMAIEAMACQKPVIVFEGTALPDVTHAPLGAVAVKPSVGDLKAAMQKFLTDESARMELADNARKIVVDNYDVDTHVDRMIALYLEARNRGEAPAKALAKTR